jgi:hypothetical protein
MKAGHLEEAVCLGWLLPCLLGWGMAAEPENLAPRAKVWASSEYDAGFAARFAVDGKVPEAETRENDAGLVWCINRAKAGDEGEFVFQWDSPVAVGELVYFGRTAQLLSECWKDYEVYLDGDAAPAAKGTFKMIHGPQRVPLAPRTVGKLRLRFLNSYGPYNPGASEIAVYSASPSDAQLAKFLEDPPAASPLKKQLLAGELGFRDLLVVQRRPLHTSHVYTYHAEGFMPGGGLYVYSPATGSLRELLASPQGMIMDCDLSFDGKEVVFSWKCTGEVLRTALNNQEQEHDRADSDANYQVYRINIDGTGLTQLTRGTSHNLNACWLPDGGIAFISDRKPAYAYCFITTSPVLYRMERDGSRQRRLSSNYLMDFTPSVLNDGRILYTRWEYVDRGACPIQSMWTIRPDGTGLGGFFKNRMLVPGSFLQARPIPGGDLVLALASNHNGDCRGAICIIDVRQGANTRAAVRNVTPEVDLYRVEGVYGNGLVGPYETPYPIDPHRFLVSRNGNLELRDFDATDRAVLLKAKGGLGFYSAQPVRSRPRPPVIPSTLPEEPSGPWATVVMANVYQGLEGYVQPGEIKQIAVVQEIEKSIFTPLIHDVPFAKGYAANTAFGYQFPLVSCGATYSPKKVWGYAEVGPDGAACFKVPAEAPIYFLALDRHGRAVQRMRTFTHLMPGEVQGCTGCHADRSSVIGSPRLSPPELARQAQHPQELTPPPWGVKGFSYLEVVQPVLDRYCLDCHNARSTPKEVDLSGDQTDFFNVSYDILARKGTLGERQPGEHNVRLDSRDEGRSPYTSWIATINGADYNILLAEPKTWGSPKSKLADIVLSGHPDTDRKPRFRMDADSQRRIMAWIDLNVPYYPSSAPDYPRTMGCRRLMPEELDAVLNQIAKARCAQCHEKGVPRRFYTRITHPELNNFLLAPLAKSAGGTEACGKAVFASKADPDYQSILRTFEPIQKILRETPRSDILAHHADFPGERP